MAFFTNGSSHAPIPPLGVHVVPGGVQVAVFASQATGVELCLLDEVPGSEPVTYKERRVTLSNHTYGVWHDFVPNIEEGQRYGFRIMGEWEPRRGLRHNPTKLLVDPYARGISGELSYVPQIYGYARPGDTLFAPDPKEGDAPLPPVDMYGPADSRDSMPFVPHSRVVGPRPQPVASRPHVPWRDTVIYEAHVKGLTKNLMEVPEHLRGTYAGAAHPATIAHLKDLGITTLELLPIHAFVSEPHLAEKGLTNYWGYNTLGFFAPHEAYATASAQAAGPGAVVDEVRGMVQLLHEAGIEVILDVVYNHTCEGGNDGPQLSWRGLDNLGYYMHDGASPANFGDVTGCGNTLDFRHPRVIQMALDSLRYWVQDIGVDGFRFDLAVTLGRDSEGFTPEHPFLMALQTDPVINQAKLIAEPWDVGPGGWQTGRFPAPFSEWNDRYRNSVRDFWLSDAAAASHGRSGSGIRELATRLSGSVDLFGHSDPPLMRGPVASINFVTAHDGFTLHDLVAYNHKHNEANGEESRDGTNDNKSWNHGVEGNLSGDDMWQVIAPLRRRSMRNLLATLILSAGTPMLSAGDEFGRTQNGNNNPYCQDNDISWLPWDRSRWRQDLYETTRFLLELRRTYPALRVEDFFSGQPLPHDEDHQPDLAWYNDQGSKITHDQWHDPNTRIFQMFRRSRKNATTHLGNAHVLMVANGTLDDCTVVLPGDDNSVRTWALVWDSQWENPDQDAQVNPANLLLAHLPVPAEGGPDLLEEAAPASANNGAQEAPNLDRLSGGSAVALEALSVQIYVAAPVEATGQTS